MGIGGFYLWLQRWYSTCVVDVPDEVVEAALNGTVSPDTGARQDRHDNLYLDMNGLIHPCCHDTAPLPEPESEEEMFERIFRQVDLLYKVVRPRRCLVMCIDGVAPQSKMNQQRCRRFRAADERIESDALSARCADKVEQEYALPRPRIRQRWDHNVITPSTAFMERMSHAIEWFVVKKLNEDPLWKTVTVILSDAHVPGEGEHKIMNYIRGLRSQPGYDHRTSHVIHGMDADLICLGLSTHEEHVTILRNQLTETYQADNTRFCYFNLYTYRQSLFRDFSNIENMDFERVLDDFIFLCFFVGNDFLPHVPLISIKTRGIEMLLDHYVRSFTEHSYLTEKGEVKFESLFIFLRNFVKTSMGSLAQEYRGVQRAKDRAKANVEERVKRNEAALVEAIKSAQSDNANKQEISNMIHGLLVSITKEREHFVAGRQPLGFSYLEDDYRDKYYEKKFGWDSKEREEFEENISRCCGEYLRGTQWVMRYYTKGCPSWEWYYPFHYAPLLQDLAKFTGPVNVKMNLSAPLHPVEQLLAVLPRLSVAALPDALHDAVMDPNSVLGVFYPDSVDVDFSEANFSYQGVLRLPFINTKKLQAACQKLVKLIPDKGVTLVICHASNELCRHLDALLNESGYVKKPIPSTVASKIPLAGSVSRYESEWPRKATIECSDSGIASKTSYGTPIKGNTARFFEYELITDVEYKVELLRKRKSAPPMLSKNTDGAPKKSSKDTQAVAAASRKRSRVTIEVDDHILTPIAEKRSPKVSPSPSSYAEKEKNTNNGKAQTAGETMKPLSLTQPSSLSPARKTKQVRTESDSKDSVNKPLKKVTKRTKRRY